MRSKKGCFHSWWTRLCIISWHYWETKRLIYDKNSNPCTPRLFPNSLTLLSASIIVTLDTKNHFHKFGRIIHHLFLTYINKLIYNINIDIILCSLSLFVIFNSDSYWRRSLILSIVLKIIWELSKTALLLRSDG